MKNITLEKYETRFPNSNEEYFNKLNIEQKQLYLDYVSKYYTLLLEFLIQKGNLKSLDDSLKNSKNNFIKVEEENMDLYQYMSSDNLQFLYLRNNIYVERLSKDDLNYLRSIDLNNLTEENFDFVKRTYELLINEEYNKTTKMNFGPMDEEFLSDSNSIIIGLRIDDYKLDDGINADQIMNIESELDFAKSFIKAKLEKVVSNVKVIRYRSGSIKSLNKKM